MHGPCPYKPSDPHPIDFLRHLLGARKSVEILKRVEPDFPIDVIVRTPRQMRERLAASDFFLRESSRTERSSLKALTREWMSKAEGDYATAAREMRARKSPNYDAACFHAQQCVEKYHKALLQECAIAFGRTHNLEALLMPLLGQYPKWSTMRPALRELTAYAVETR